MPRLPFVRGERKHQSPLEMSQVFPSIWGERISRFTEHFESSWVSQYKSGSGSQESQKVLREEDIWREAGELVVPGRTLLYLALLFKACKRFSITRPFQETLACRYDCSKSPNSSYWRRKLACLEFYTWLLQTLFPNYWLYFMQADF